MTKAEITRYEATVLGLLSEGPMHPYQIEKIIQERDMRYWTEISMSAIYKMLPSLTKRGLVDCARELTEGNRLRLVYRLTEAGRAALRNQMLEWLSEPEHIVWRMDLVIANLPNLSRKKARAALLGYQKALDKLIGEYGKLEQYLLSAGCPFYRLALARRPIHILKGERQWLDEYLNELESAERW